jgi:hypothetical protein
MGSIARSAANLITTSGVVLKGAVNNDSFDNVTALPSAAAADGITLISSQTASDSASISFTSGLTSTYKAYKFVFSNIHNRTQSTHLTFQGSTNSGSSYGITLTSTIFRAYHNEDDTQTGFAYLTASDLAQSTSYQPIVQLDAMGNEADASLNGSMLLFNPSSTTYVKHFISNVNCMDATSTRTWNHYMAGYFNTTSAINAIDFKMASGNMDGTIYLYGIK